MATHVRGGTLPFMARRLEEPEFNKSQLASHPQRSEKVTRTLPSLAKDFSRG